MNKYIQKGFTLIEILIVITIIGVLVGFLLPNLTGIGGKTNDIARKKLLGEVVSNVEMFYLENGSYPDGTFCIDGEADGAVPATNDEKTLVSYFGNVAPSQEFTADENAYCTDGADNAPMQNHDRVYYQKLNNSALEKYAVFMRSEDPVNHDQAFTIENGITNDKDANNQTLSPAADDATNVMVIIK